MITIKSKEEIKTLREGGKILAGILEEVKKKVAPGVTTMELNQLAEELILKSGGKPSFKGYSPYGIKGKKYPCSLCTSLNDVVVHGVPSPFAILKEGDVLGLDIGMVYKRLYTDMAETVGVGQISDQAKKLIEVTKTALEIGIAQIKSGNTIGDIGYAIQQFVEANGFNIVRDLVGHGVGYKVHEDPYVPNFGKKGEGHELKEGMVIAIEPMVVTGQPDIELTEDEFGFATIDGGLSAHFEHTIAVTIQGHEVLTKL